VLIDIGTGSGLSIAHSARLNPAQFFIGVDANPRPLEKISERIHRRPEKGGLPNVLFVQAAVEHLPSELDGIACQVHVQFPWGSLLRAVATGEPLPMRNLRRISKSGAALEVVLGLDPVRDRSEIERLNLQALSADYIKSVLAPRYKEAGFEIVDQAALAHAGRGQMNSAWAKRLSFGGNRELFRIRARAL